MFERFKVDNKIIIVVTFSKDHALEWWTSKIIEELEMVASLTWVGFKELLIKRFTPHCQNLCEGMNLVQMRHMGPLKAYVRDLNT